MRDPMDAAMDTLVAAMKREMEAEQAVTRANAMIDTPLALQVRARVRHDTARADLANAVSAYNLNVKRFIAAQRTDSFGSYATEAQRA